MATYTCRILHAYLRSLYDEIRAAGDDDLSVPMSDTAVDSLGHAMRLFKISDGTMMMAKRRTVLFWTDAIRERGGGEIRYASHYEWAVCDVRPAYRRSSNRSETWSPIRQASDRRDGDEHDVQVRQVRVAGRELVPPARVSASRIAVPATDRDPASGALP